MYTVVLILRTLNIYKGNETHDKPTRVPQRQQTDL